MIFVSAPYYHFEKDIIEKRVAIVSKYCGKLLNDGIIAFSPVCFGHQIVKYCSLPNDFNYWDKFSITLLSKCKEMHVLQIDGWEKSKGVKAEIEYSIKKKIKIKYIAKLSI